MTQQNFTLTQLSPDPVDSRDYIFNIPDSVIPNLPTKVDLRPFAGAVENQLQTGSCVANATVAALELLLHKSSTFVDLSRLFVYWNARKDYSELRGKDTGAYVVDGFKSCMTYGVCPESVWGFNISEVNSEPDQNSYTTALERKVGIYERVGQFSLGGGDNNSVDLIKATLAMGYPVVIGMRLGQNFYNISGEFSNHTTQYAYGVNTTDNKFIGGHAMCIVGYDDSLGGFITKNSWGDSWGNAGYACLKYSVITTDCHDAWTCTNFAGVQFQPEWSYPTSQVLSLVSQSIPETFWTDEPLEKMSVTIQGGTAPYDYWWRTDNNGIGLNLIIKPGDNLLHTSEVTFRVNASPVSKDVPEATVNLLVSVLDSSLPTKQRIDVIVPVKFIYGKKIVVPELQTRKDAAIALLYQLSDFLAVGDVTGAKARYNKLQSEINFGQFSDEEFSVAINGKFTPEQLKAWKSS